MNYRPACFSRQRLRFWQSWCAVWIGVALIAVLHADPVDYSAGFSKLQKLGLPDLSSAKYIHIDFSPGSPGGASLLENNQSLGNAWLIEEASNGVAKVVINQLEVVELLSLKAVEERQQKRMDAVAAKAKAEEPDNATEEGEALGFEPGLPAYSGQWKPADLQADARKLLKFLGQTNSEDTAAGSDSSREFYPKAVPCFLFTVHLFSQGQTNEANQLAGLLFQRISQRKLLSAVMDQMAYAAYIQAWTGFQKNGDWRGYLATIDELCARFGPVWKGSAQAAKVASQVRRQLAQPSPPEIRGEGIEEADRQLARFLAPTNAPLVLNHSFLTGIDWLAAAPKAAMPASPWDALQNRGLQAIPMLIALLKDDWLVWVAKVGERNGLYQSGRYFRDFAEPFSGEQEPALIPQPMSRGEIARKILEPIVVSSAPELRYRETASLPVEELVQQSQAWYEQHRQFGRFELPRQLLGEGRTDVFSFLAKSTNQLDRQAVEAFLLATNHCVDSFANAQQYVQTQGPAARDFVEKYVALLKNMPSLVPSQERRYYSGNTLEQREKQIRDQLKAMEKIAAGNALESSLKELLEQQIGRKGWRQAAQIFEAALAREAPEKALPQLLKASLTARDKGMADYLLRDTLRYSQRPPSAGAGQAKLNISACAELWTQLLDREERLKAELSSNEMLDGNLRVGLIIEILYGNPRVLSESANIAHLGSRLQDFYTQRARARLAGKTGADLPAFPSKARVSDSRKEEIHQLLLTSTEPYVLTDKLTLDELLVVPEILVADASLNARLSTNAFLIRDVRCPWSHSPAGDVFQVAKGKPFDRAFLEALLVETKKWAAQGSNLTVNIRRDVPLAGVVISVNGPAGNRPQHRPGKPQKFTYVTANLNMAGAGEPEQLNAFLNWMVKVEGPSTPAQPAAPKAAKIEAPAAAQVGAATTEIPPLEVPPPEGLKAPEEDALPDDEPAMRQPDASEEKTFWECFDKMRRPEVNAGRPFQFMLSIQDGTTWENE